jgi:hypothetical protein
MRITCYKSDPINLVFTFEGEHNHELGSPSDFEYLPVAKNTKSVILQKLKEGFMYRDIRLSVQRQLTQYAQQNINVQVDGAPTDQLNEIVHRDQLLDGNAVYNQYTKIHEKAYKRYEDEHESIRLWLKELNEDGD